MIDLTSGGLSHAAMLALTPATLTAARAEFRRGGPVAEALLAEAAARLLDPPGSVCEKTELPPSGDKHDYQSLGGYWWPDPASPTGLPYIRRDGEMNPEIGRTDRPRLGRMEHAVVTLAAATDLTGDQRFAGGALRALRTWFLDPATRMNPHLRFGQGIPGRCEGRCIGIVDTEGLVRVLDALPLLDNHPEAPLVVAGVRAWSAAYLDWLLIHPYGIQEAAEHNNHGTVYDVQVVALALATGRDELARTVLRAVPDRRIRPQLEPDGRQPHELARTRAWTYSLKNLFALLNLASFGRRVGVELWDHETADGRSIRKALAWLTPFATGVAAWAHPELGGLVGSHLAPALLRAAELQASDTDEPYRTALRALGTTPGEISLRLMGHAAALRETAGHH